MGDPSRSIDIPLWIDYELYTKVEVQNTVGESNMWLFDMDSDSSAAYNFGAIVADREFIYLLDRFNRPIVPKEAHTGEAHTGEAHTTGGTGTEGNLLHIHARALNKPSLMYYYSSPGHDPFEKGGDFKRGYPYSLREGG